LCTQNASFRLLYSAVSLAFHRMTSRKAILSECLVVSGPGSFLYSRKRNLIGLWLEKKLLANVIANLLRICGMPYGHTADTLSCNTSFLPHQACLSVSQCLLSRFLQRHQSDMMMEWIRHQLNRGMHLYLLKLCSKTENNITAWLVKLTQNTSLRPCIIENRKSFFLLDRTSGNEMNDNDKWESRILTSQTVWFEFWDYGQLEWMSATLHLEILLGHQSWVMTSMPPASPHVAGPETRHFIEGPDVGVAAVELLCLGWRRYAAKKVREAERFTDIRIKFTLPAI